LARFLLYRAYSTPAIKPGYSGETLVKTNKITLWVLIALVLGIAVGYGCHTSITDPKQLKDVAGYFSILTDVFMRLIKMIIAPW
jgi:Na+/H+-dicarboxylate symporter